MRRHVDDDDHLARQAARKEFWTRLFVVLLLGWMLTTSVVQTWGIIQGNETIQAVRDTQTEGSPILKAISSQADELQHSADNSQAILDQLQDCLQPEGDCAKRSKRQTSNVVSLILVGVSCSQGYTDLSDAQRIEATQECVAHWLSHHPRYSSP